MEKLKARFKQGRTVYIAYYEDGVLKKSDWYGIENDKAVKWPQMTTVEELKELRFEVYRWDEERKFWRSLNTMRVLLGERFYEWDLNSVAQEIQYLYDTEGNVIKIHNLWHVLNYNQYLPKRFIEGDDHLKGCTSEILDAARMIIHVSRFLKSTLNGV